MECKADGLFFNYKHGHINIKKENAFVQAKSKAKIWPVNYIINVKVLPPSLWQKQSEKGVRVGEKNQLKKENCISLLPASKRKISVVVVVEIVENIKLLFVFLREFVGCMWKQ